jgi:Serine/Threonine/Tyrosine Kinase found in polyvalent proteins
MPHGDRSEEDSREALEHASNDLRAGSEAIRGSAAGSITLVRDAEAQRLRDWARARGLILDPFEYLSPAWIGGEEHLVWNDEAHERHVKLTKANCFGLTVGAEWFFDEVTDEADFKAALRGATPLEYLDRLLLHNEVFGDEIELLGIIDKRQAMHVVTSQPTITGLAAPIEEIAAFMSRLGFRALPDLKLGRLGAVSFLRDSDRVAAFDCHPANFLQRDGDVFPIDVILVRAEDDLLAALS